MSKRLLSTGFFSTAPSHRNGGQRCIHSLCSNTYKVSSLLQQNPVPGWITTVHDSWFIVAGQSIEVSTYSGASDKGHSLSRAQYKILGARLLAPNYTFNIILFKPLKRGNLIPIKDN